MKSRLINSYGWSCNRYPTPIYCSRYPLNHNIQVQSSKSSRIFAQVNRSPRFALKLLWQSTLRRCDQFVTAGVRVADASSNPLFFLRLRRSWAADNSSDRRATNSEKFFLSLEAKKKREKTGFGASSQPKKRGWLAAMAPRSASEECAGLLPRPRFCFLARPQPPRFAPKYRERYEAACPRPGPCH